MPTARSTGTAVLAAWIATAAGCGAADDTDAARAADVASADALDADQTSVNALTRDEIAAGWRLLFDGRSTAGWRGYRAGGMPAGWDVVEGALTRIAPAGDIVTSETFRDFELALDWKVAEGGNSGIMFRVTEDATESYESGPEMQLLDDARHPDGDVPETRAGANYGLHAPAHDVARPAGEWNEARIVARGPHVAYWLNGTKVVEYEIGSPDWEARVRRSKFGAMPGYGRAPEGHIALQDHGDWVAFRNIRIRPL